MLLFGYVWSHAGGLVYLIVFIVVGGLSPRDTIVPGPPGLTPYEPPSSTTNTLPQCDYDNYTICGYDGINYNSSVAVSSSGARGSLPLPPLPPLPPLLCP